MKRNDVFSLILTLTALDNLFNVLLFLAGILFIISVTGHHHLSLILCLPSPAVITQPRRFSPTPGRPHPPPAVITHSRPSPVVPLTYFFDTCPAVISINCSFYPPPAVLTSTLPSFDAPYSPPHNPGSPQGALPWTGRRLAVPSCRVPSRLLGVIPAVPVGPLDGSEHCVEPSLPTATSLWQQVSIVPICWKYQQQYALEDTSGMRKGLKIFFTQDMPSLLVFPLFSQAILLQSP